LKTLILHLFVDTLAILTGAYLLPGVAVDGLLTALVVAIVLGVVNVLLRPLLVVLTLPLTILTLGLFLFVINALMIVLVAKLVPGFHVSNFGWALAYSLLITVVSSFLNFLRERAQRLP
jgi:putative membrane protein